MAEPNAPEPLGIVLISADHGAVHAAWLLAASAAALGRPVVLFATGAGTQALCTGHEHPDDEVLQARNVATTAELRTAAIELATRLIACDSGLRGQAIDPARLLPSVERAGMAAFLEATAGGQLIAF